MKGMEHRCSYVNMKNPLYICYHDEEWGVPEHSDKKLYELLILESFQAGLSWECILNKRENFRIAFDGFDIDKVCDYDEAKCAELLTNPGIVRNRRKIAAAVNNSVVFKAIQQEFGSFDAYIWGFTNGETIVEDFHIRTTSPLSDTVSKDLKKRGMKFVGSTIIYSYLQAIGVLNAHGAECDLCPGRLEATP
ncbi:MAG: DNA-3-methyladenine glycosylase I [Oscillospiraceae bacterium]|nr:DNA-3-methyladenine glycosylase I [Oscillospiraceae bacterium]